MNKTEKAAMICLPEEERERIAGEVEKLLSYISILDTLDIGDVQGEESQKPGLFLREDEPIQEFNAEEMLANAPKSRNGMFVVPSSISGQEDMA